MVSAPASRVVRPGLNKLSTGLDALAADPPAVLASIRVRWLADVVTGGQQPR
jgi:hypothetical protein